MVVASLRSHVQRGSLDHSNAAWHGMQLHMRDNISRFFPLGETNVELNVDLNDAREPTTLPTGKR